MNIKLFLLLFWLGQTLIAQPSYGILIWIKADCPVCHKIVPDLKMMTAESDSKLKIYFVNSQSKEIKRYLKKYQISSEWEIDKDFQMADRFGVTVSPEVVVLDNEGNKIYQGALNDAIPQLGVHLEAKQHFWKNALTDWKEGKKVSTPYKAPIGCVFR